MSKYLTALPLVAALALTAPVALFAQTTTAPEDTGNVTITNDPDVSAPKTVEDLLSLGEDANAPADQVTALGQPYTKEEVGAWEMRCIRTEDDVDPCQMYQLMDDGEGNPVAEVSLFRLPSGGKAVAGATIVVPLETSLPAQMTIAVDGANPRRYPFAFCNPVGCYVRLGMTDPDVDAFKRGNQATVTIVPALAPDQKVELTLSLEGFTAGYDQVSVIDQ